MAHSELTATLERAHQPPIQKILKPIQSFIKLETSGGILLLLCTVVALVWANSPWSNSYTSLWQTPFTIGFGEFVLNKAFILWINDGLMAIFFFVVGLEIKRELLSGELSSFRKAALPIAAAIGGMVVPAGIYFLINRGTEGAAGWGIPMATDIAFALGVLAMLGKRAPLALKIFLTALAIVDDIGAVLVIALFYTAQISWTSLGIGAILLVALFAANRLGVRAILVYMILGAALWLAFLKSGVHATIAGVLLAFTIPARSVIDHNAFRSLLNAVSDKLVKRNDEREDKEKTDDEQAAVHTLEKACEMVESPLQRLEHGLHPWVTYMIIPVFALANAGVTISGSFTASLTSQVSLGIIFGLIFGKQIGVTLFSWLAVKTKMADLPANVSWRQIYGVSCLAGIGFTMSLFIATLGFGESMNLTYSKIGILAASLISGIAGWLLLFSTRPADS